MGFWMANARTEVVELCEASIDDVYRYALRLCGGDAHRTADLVQDTFAALMRHLERRPDDEVGLPWLITCCRHRHIDGLRRSQRRVRNEQRSWSRALVEEIDHGVGEAVAALATVDEPGRTALVLRFVDGLSIAEIAEALGRSVAAADSLLRRSRMQLQHSYLQSLEQGR